MRAARTCRPATSIAWGAWGEIGRATTFAEQAGDAITPEEGDYAFGALLRHNRRGLFHRLDTE